MPLQALRVTNYRSLRDIDVPLGNLNVIIGPNGSGKSNLYRAIWLLAQISEGEFARAIAREGGLPSTLWAGPRTNKKPLRMSLGFQADELSFELTCGYPPLSSGRFGWDPEIKEEALWLGKHRKPTTTLLERKGGHTFARDTDGNPVQFLLTLSENESILSQLRDPERFPVLYSLRDEIRNWRFYHNFRSDADSPARVPQIATFTPVLSNDGHDLAAALASIRKIGDRNLLEKMIASAFPGRSLEILRHPDPGQDPGPLVQAPAFWIGLRDERLRRTLHVRELSDGTLKFLWLMAALLSPRPPAMLVVNEPETSLHPDLIPSLGELIIAAAANSQVIVCTHSVPLVRHIERQTGQPPIQLAIHKGETVIQPR